MKVPGRAWLEFKVEPDGPVRKFIKQRSMTPRDLFGLVYWYTLYPVQGPVFNGMLRGIAERARRIRGRYPNEADNIKWGILAPGGHLRGLRRRLQEAEGAELAAVGSRDIVRARSFAEKYGISRAHGSYAELAADPEVDAIYIATPHTFHERDAVLCLGKRQTRAL